MGGGAGGMEDWGGEGGKSGWRVGAAGEYRLIEKRLVLPSNSH